MNQTFQRTFFSISVLEFAIVKNESAFTCSKLTMEKLEQGVKYIQN